MFPKPLNLLHAFYMWVGCLIVIGRLWNKSANPRVFCLSHIMLVIMELKNDRHTAIFTNLLNKINYQLRNRIGRGIHLNFPEPIRVSLSRSKNPERIEINFTEKSGEGHSHLSIGLLKLNDHFESNLKKIEIIK